MSVRILDMLAAARKRPAEFAWVETCRAYDAAEQAGQPLLYDQLRQLTMTALDRCRVTGQLSASQIAVLIEHGVSGPPRADGAARAVWDRSLQILETEMNRMAFPTTPPPKSPTFFYGLNGTPFIDAANAWFWALDCLEARHSGSRASSSDRLGRPCDPDDVVNAMRRLDLSPIHLRTVVAWGKKHIEPNAGTDPRRLWDEAMALLTTALREKGIIRGRPITDLELMDLPLLYCQAVTGKLSKPHVAADDPALEPTNFKAMLKRRSDDGDVSITPLEMKRAAFADEAGYPPLRLVEAGKSRRPAAKLSGSCRLAGSGPVEECAPPSMQAAE